MHRAQNYARHDSCYLRLKASTNEAQSVNHLDTLKDRPTHAPLVLLQSISGLQDRQTSIGRQLPPKPGMGYGAHLTIGTRNSND